MLDFGELKDSKISTLTQQHSHKVSQFHKNLKSASGPKLKELQVRIISSNHYHDCVFFFLYVYLIPFLSIKKTESGVIKGTVFGLFRTFFLIRKYELKKLKTNNEECYFVKFLRNIFSSYSFL